MYFRDNMNEDVSAYDVQMVGRDDSDLDVPKRISLMGKNTTEKR